MSRYFLPRCSIIHDTQRRQRDIMLQRQRYVRAVTTIAEARAFVCRAASLMS